MENILIRCKSCNKEIQGKSGKSIACGCSNMATILDNSKITAVDLSSIVMINSPIIKKNNNNILTNEDIAWQEERRKRKVRRLDFEIR
jgi:hypothetical protein